MGTRKVQWKTSRFQGKVLLGILVPVIAFCLFTNIMISILLGYRLMQKKEDIEEEYLSVIYKQLDTTKEALDILALTAENSYSVKWAMEGDGFDTMDKKRYALNAQKSLTASLEGSNVKEYVDHMFLMNRNGLKIAITPSMKPVQTKDVFSSPIMGRCIGEAKAKAGLAESVVDEGKVKLIYMYPLDRADRSYLYIEMNPRMFREILIPYEESSGIVIADRFEREWNWCSSEKIAEVFEENESGNRYTGGGRVYKAFGLTLEVMPENRLYSSEILNIIFTFIATLVLSLCIGIVVSRMISTRITQPLNSLSRHISRMSDKTSLVTDLTIEEGEDEVADIGKAFNMLVRHINRLMEQQKEMYEQKQKLEMNALQAQINPHFMYNMLDSVRWMAVFQNADNIAEIVMSLENLLRNMAKGIGMKISLREELSLAADYVKLQQVRYMEIFDYICDVPEEYLECKIVKMSMQPIIENAILHGIVPTGTYGEVCVTVREKDGDLYISIEDNGAGIDKEDFEKVVTSENKNAMSGIGIINVDERLRMTYGEEYGLIYEGEKEKFARVTIHIPKEMGDSDV